MDRTPRPRTQQDTRQRRTLTLSPNKPWMPKLAPSDPQGDQAPAPLEVSLPAQEDADLGPEARATKPRCHTCQPSMPSSPHYATRGHKLGVARTWPPANDAGSPSTGLEPRCSTEGDMP